MDLTRNPPLDLVDRTVIYELAEHSLNDGTLLTVLSLSPLERRPALATAIAIRQSPLVRHTVAFDAVQKATLHSPSAAVCADEIEYCPFVRALHLVLCALGLSLLIDDDGVGVFPLPSSSTGLLCEVDHALQDVDV